jgi:predicted DsbA family dithiol-disulfide isomerase
VNKASTNDISEVYQFKAKEYKTILATATYSSNQTATKIIDAPGENKRIVITYLAFRSAANTGTAYINDGVRNIGTTYFEAQKDLSASNVLVDCAENAAITVTTTTGSVGMTVAILYHIEEA